MRSPVPIAPARPSWSRMRSSCPAQASARSPSTSLAATFARASLTTTAGPSAGAGSAGADGDDEGEGGGDGRETAARGRGEEHAHGRRLPRLADHWRRRGRNMACGSGRKPSLRYHGSEAWRRREREPDEVPAVDEQVHHPLPDPEALVGRMDDDRRDDRVLRPVRDGASGADEPVAVPRRGELRGAGQGAARATPAPTPGGPSRRTGAASTTSPGIRETGPGRPGPRSPVPSARTRRRSSSHRWSKPCAWIRRSTFASVHVSPWRSAVSAPSSARPERAQPLGDPRPRPRQRVPCRHLVQWPVVAAAAGQSADQPDLGARDVAQDRLGGPLAAGASVRQGPVRGLVRGDPVRRGEQVLASPREAPERRRDLLLGHADGGRRGTWRSPRSHPARAGRRRRPPPGSARSAGSPHRRRGPRATRGRAPPG